LSPQKSINIIGDARPKTQDAEDSFSFAIQHLESSVLRLESCMSDYSHYLVWIAEPFNTNVLQHFHQQIMITFITYSIANHYYMHYLQRNRKTCKLRTDNRKLESYDYLTSKFHQVAPFSLFHCPSTARQTKRRRALSVILTHRNKTEMAYQVMTKITENQMHP